MVRISLGHAAVTRTLTVSEASTIDCFLFMLQIHPKLVGDLAHQIPSGTQVSDASILHTIPQS